MVKNKNIKNKERELTEAEHSRPGMLGGLNKKRREA